MDLLAQHAPVIGLLFFFIVFVWITINTYRPGAKQRLQYYASIPLKEDSTHE